jgi:penicillin-binding protein 1A
MFVGLERSRNLMTVRILQELGLEPVAEITERYGVYDEMPLLYSMALGAGEATPLEMATAYAMIANGGRRIEPSLIERVQDRTGATLLTRAEAVCAGCEAEEWRDGLSAPTTVDERELINDPISTFQVLTMMQGVTTRGTAARLASLGLPLAGKTGTTNDSFDAWFVGFSPNLVVAVFVGFDTPRTLGPGETGGSVAAPIFGAFMERALDGVDPGSFPQPEGVEMVAIDPETGYLAGPDTASVTQAFRPGTAPDETAAQAAAGPVTSFGEGVEQSTQGTGGLY